METTKEEVLEAAIVDRYNGPSIPCEVGGHGEIWPHEDEFESATWEISTLCDWCGNESLSSVCESFANALMMASGSTMITCRICDNEVPKDMFVNWFKPIKD